VSLYCPAIVVVYETCSIPARAEATVGCTVRGMVFGRSGDETCPVSTGEGTRRVLLVRGGARGAPPSTFRRRSR
jgi:hypothetical protein